MVRRFLRSTLQLLLTAAVLAYALLKRHAEPGNERAGTPAPRSERSPRLRPRRALVGIGVALAGVYVGYWVITGPTPPREDPGTQRGSPSLVLMVAQNSFPGLDWMSVVVNEHVAVDWKGCSDVEAQASFLPTQTFWSHARLRNPVPIAIAITPPDVTNFRVIARKGLPQSELNLIPDAVVRAFAAGSPDVHVTSGNDEHGAYVVTGTIRNWRPNQLPVTISFNASWATNATSPGIVFPFGSCEVSTPALTAPSSLSAAGEALDHVVGTRLDWFAAGDGHTTLSVAGRTLIDDASRRPTGFSDTGYVWQCSAGGNVNVREPDQEPLPPGISIPLPIGSSDCASVVPITTPDLETYRTLAILLLGAVIAVGMQITYDGLTRR